MKPLTVIVVPLFVLVSNITVLAAPAQGESGKHLFIFVCQHRNAMLDPKEHFTPLVTDAFGSDNVIVVAADNNVESVDAWKESMDNALRKHDAIRSGPLYPALADKLWSAIRRKKLASATLVWMVGKGDAKEGLAEAYYDNLRRMVWTLRRALRRSDMNVVIGRIPNTDPANPYATMVREAQVKVANEMVRADWVDTDDVGTRKDGLATLEKELAEKAVTLIKDAPTGKHLFLLSGQSNMVNLYPIKSFNQIVGGNLGTTEVVTVSQSGQKIRRWYKAWKPLNGVPPEDTGDLYDKLITTMKDSAGDPKGYDTVTFVWMQGESDTGAGHAEVYLDSLKGLVAQLKNDLGRDDLNVVIGRINSNVRAMRKSKEKARCWQLVRLSQVQAAKEIPRATWVNTDDLCTEETEAHMTKEGYWILGERFATEALRMIRDYQ